MSIVYEKATIEVSATIVLSEPMFRALSKALEWGVEPLVQGMTAQCSQSEIRQHIPALTEMMQRLRSDLPIAVRKADEARGVFDGTKLALDKPRPKSGKAWRLVDVALDDGID